ncbi:unnamed protein product [Gadus morhua 'NCC']
METMAGHVSGPGPPEGQRHVYRGRGPGPETCLQGPRPPAPVDMSLAPAPGPGPPEGQRHVYRGRGPGPETCLQGPRPPAPVDIPAPPL